MDDYTTTQIYIANQNLWNNDSKKESPIEIKESFKRFVREFKTNNTIYYYKEQLIANYQKNYSVFECKQDDLANWDSKLEKSIQENPLESIVIFEQGLKEIINELLFNYKYNSHNNSNDNSNYINNIPDFQFILISNSDARNLRELNSNDVGKLISISGIIVSTSSPSIKSSLMMLNCKSCGHIKSIQVKPGFSGITIPRQCENNKINTSSNEKCPLDSYVIDSENTKYIDQQILKIQETPESIPTGEIPRSFLLYCDRSLVNKASPGNRVFISGVYTANEQSQLKITKKSKLIDSNQKPYIKVIGILMENKKIAKSIYNFTNEEEHKFINFSKDPSNLNFY